MLLHEAVTDGTRGESFVRSPVLTYPMEPYAVMVC